MRETIHIISSAAENYFMGLVVTLCSTLSQATGSYDYSFYVLDGGISSDKHESLEQQLGKIAADKNIGLSYRPIPLTDRAMTLFPDWRNNKMTYAKFIAIERLENVKQCIYLDSDLLVNKGLEELYSISKDKEVLLAGVLDGFSTLGKDPPSSLTLSEKDKASPYVNAGVLWMNLHALRKSEINRKAIELLNENPTLRHGDQTLLNYLCRNRIQVVGEEHNFCLLLGTGMEVVQRGEFMNLHFIGEDKPWLNSVTTSQAFARQLWLRYAREIELELSDDSNNETLPYDLKKFFWKRFNILNPKRAKRYWRDYCSAKYTEIERLSI